MRWKDDLKWESEAKGSIFRGKSEEMGDLKVLFGEYESNLSVGDGLDVKKQRNT